MRCRCEQSAIYTEVSQRTPPHASQLQDGQLSWVRTVLSVHRDHCQMALIGQNDLKRVFME
jgi:hypothetical protein